MHNKMVKFGCEELLLWCYVVNGFSLQVWDVGIQLKIGERKRHHSYTVLLLETCKKILS